MPTPSPDPDLELQSRRESLRRGLLRVQTLGVSVLLLVLVLAAAALLQAWRAEQKSTEAMAASGQAERELWRSRLLQAESGRLSGRLGRRAESLAAIRAAAAWQPSVELRAEAVGALALADWEGPADRPAVPRGALVKAVDSPGRRFAAVTSQGEVWVAEVTNGAAAYGLATGITDFAVTMFSPDGASLAVRAVTGELQVWDLAAHRRRFTLPGLTAGPFWAYCMGFSPDARVLAVRQGDRAVHFYDAGDGHEVRPPLALAAEPGLLRWDPTGTRLALAANQSRWLEIYDLAGATAPWKEEFPAVLAAFAWRPDGGGLAVGGADGGIWLLDLSTDRRRELQGHSDNVGFLEFHPSGGWLASASWDGTAHFWDAGVGASLFTLQQGVPLGFSANGERVLVAEAGSSALVAWRVQLGTGYRSLRDPQGGPRNIWSTAFDPQGRWLAAGSERGVELWDLTVGRRVDRSPVGATFTVAADPGGGGFASAGATGFRRWEVLTNAGQLRLAAPRPELPEADSLPVVVRWVGAGPGRLALARGAAWLGGVDAAAPPRRFPGSGAWNSGDVDPTGRWLATGSWLGEGVCVWDTLTGGRTWSWPHDAMVAFTRDGRRLVIGTGTEYSVRAVDDWREVWRLTRSTAGVNTGPVGIDPTSRLLAVARAAATVELRDPVTGQLLVELPSPNPQQIRALTFDAQGERLAVATGNEEIQLWDLAALRAQLALLGLAWDGDGARFTPVAQARAPGRPSSALLALVAASILLAVALLAAVFQRHHRLIAAYEEIETTAATRGRALAAAQVEIFHSHKMRALGTLAAGIAHDFNNLLSVIRMANKSIARQAPPDPEIAADLADIEQTVLQGKTIVQSMLGYSRVAAANQPAGPVAEVVRDTLNLLSKPFLAGIEVKLELEGDAVAAAVSSARLGQMLLNLVVNAAEALAGKGRLRVALETAARENYDGCLLRPRPAARYLELLVEDSGPGIPRDVRERIFEPFFTTKHTGANRGTGLGLSVVYTLAQQEGIGIHLESAPGRGTAFRLILPRE